jgi:thioester reductase-like protein
MGFQKNVFITGFPGFIATRLVNRLATPNVRFHLLVEPRYLSAALAQVERIRREKNLASDNFVFHEGDITKDFLGLPADSLETMRGTVTDVFHLAAVYDLAVDANLAKMVNVQGTENINVFAASLQGLERYNYISTCYVAGRRTGRILESELEHGAGFRNHYEETKYLAELSVEKLKSSLPVTIIRPSVVVGDSMTGETVKYDGVYYLIKYLLLAPSLLRFINVGNSKVRLNLVPVDFVVEGIRVLSESPQAIGKTLALADPNPLTTEELFDAIALSSSGGPSLFTPPTALIQAFLKSPISPGLTGLPHSGVPYFFIEQEYDVTQSATILSGDDITCPSFDSYVERLISFAKNHPNL